MLLDQPPKRRNETCLEPRHLHHQRKKPFGGSQVRKFFGLWLSGTCDLAYYRSISVAVGEFKPRQARSQDEIKKDVLMEAETIGQLSDHCGLPLLFGTIRKLRPLRLITQFHGENSCTTLLYAIKKLKLDKPSWQGILINISVAKGHIHKAGVLHNNLKNRTML